MEDQGNGSWVDVVTKYKIVTVQIMKLKIYFWSQKLKTMKVNYLTYT